MAAQYSFLATGTDLDLIIEWFGVQNEDMTVNENAERIVYYFRSFDSKPLPAAEQIDQDTTPLVFINKPQMQRDTLWTDGLVLFTPTPLKTQFPALQKINQSFAKWLKRFDLVFSQKPSVQNQWNYWLEAGIQNYDAELYALPNAMQALAVGQYFVHHRANSAQIDALIQRLRLRGHASY